MASAKWGLGPGPGPGPGPGDEPENNNEGNTDECAINAAKPQAQRKLQSFNMDVLTQRDVEEAPLLQ